VRFSDLAGRRVGVWGAGREGLAAHTALRQQDPAREVVVYTDEEVPDERREAFGAGAQFEHGPDGFGALEGCEVVIRSPGVSRYRPEVERLGSSGVELTTGTNLWFAEHGDERVVAVTGTKGKSTTTSLIAHLLNESGVRATLGGNVGRPLLDVLDLDPGPEVWVLELSSFQAADLERGPSIGVLLNVHPEHLDWHGTAERYMEDKVNLLRRNPDCLAVLNWSDERVRELAGHLPNARLFGDIEGFHLDNDGAICRSLDRLYEPDALRLQGRHNALNACAALTVVQELGLDATALGEQLGSFEPLPHRLEPVGVYGGRTFVNDSISTTPPAAIAALEALAGSRIAMIVGGYERGQDYAPLARRIVDSGVQLVIGLPDTGKRIVAEVEGVEADQPPATRLAADLDEAVRVAAEGVPAGGVVLLSPAAPSYVQFRDFEERGLAFAQAAARVKEPA
jgi:UDP-N-acetylmuramoylalanine--D-glutamate ligase